LKKGRLCEIKIMAYNLGLNRELVESLDFGAVVGVCLKYFEDRIDKLAGDKLI